MSKNVSFTICAKNYIGLAQVLEKSIKRHNPDLDFYIFVADEATEQERELINNLSREGNKILFAREVLKIPLGKWHELSFKYNLTEFCTAIKSKCFEYLFKELHYEKAIFFDPDILVFHPLSEVFEELESSSILLTPHLLDINAATRSSADIDLLNTGIFNLGFAALANNEIAMEIINWWTVKLFDYCYIDYFDGYFTDQKWMNLVATYIKSGHLLILDNLGMNVAPWNFSERSISMKNGQYWVSLRLNSSVTSALIFVHYSGFDYKRLISGEVVHTTKPDIILHEDANSVFKIYQEELVSSNFLALLGMKYSYNYFDNSCPISTVQRRLYRRLLKDDKINSNPFQTTQDSFFHLLKSHKLLSPKEAGSDKANRFNTPSMGRKIKFINYIMILIFKVIGYDRYFKLIKLFREYAKIENHVHLLDKTYMENNILSK